MEPDSFTAAEADLYRRADIARANNGQMGEWSETADADSALRDVCAWAVITAVCFVAAWLLVGWLMAAPNVPLKG